MTPLRAKYQIEETATEFSFKPFHTSKSKLGWFMFAIVLFAGLSAYFLGRENYLLLIFSITLSLILVWYFAKLLLVYSPLKYTFDTANNAVSIAICGTKKKNFDPKPGGHFSEYGDG